MYVVDYNNIKPKRMSFNMNDIYKGYFKTAISIAIPIVKDYQKAQDVAQDSMIKIWKKQNTYNESKSSFYTWFRQIVIRTAYDKYRHDTLRVVLRDDNSEWQSFTCPCVNTDTIDLEYNLNKIELKYRVVLYLRYIEGEDYKKIAERLNTPFGTIKNRAKIGLRELRKIYT
tara:strand:+ start:66 stop:578 length:513 start_codon:yes stop_codon:yes gene_type:complete